MAGAEPGGLVFARLLDARGGGSPAGWTEVKAHMQGADVLWAHFDYECKDTIEWLDNISGLDPIIVQALRAQDTRPREVAASEGLMLIVRGVNKNARSEPDDMVALRMWFDASRIITLRHRKVFSIEDLLVDLDSGKGPSGPEDFLVSIVSRLTRRIGAYVDDIEQRVDSMEASQYEDSGAISPHELMNLRMEVINFRRHVAPQRETLYRLSGENTPMLSDRAKSVIREIAERTTRYVEELDLARERTTVIYEQLNFLASERLNRAMYLLAIVATLFLPLGFITGLLGINVGGMPGASDDRAFLIVIIVLTVIVLFELLVFRIKKWI